jgi:hypothetical protein
MRIGLCGAQGTGKSTILKGMMDIPELSGHAFIPSITRATKASQSISLNQEGTFETQKALVKAYCWHIKRFTNLVIPRTLLDVYAYSRYLCNHKTITAQELNYIRGRIRRVQHLFDEIFYIRPEFEIEGDDVRSCDTGFQTEMAGIFEHVIQHDTLGTKCPITVLSGTVEERLLEVRRVFAGRELF